MLYMVNVPMQPNFTTSPKTMKNKVRRYFFEINWWRVSYVICDVIFTDIRILRAFTRGVTKWREHHHVRASSPKTLTKSPPIVVWSIARCFHLESCSTSLSHPRQTEFSCADTCHENPSTHSDSETAIQGTWCSVELEKALEKGYQIVQVHKNQNR